MQIADIHTHILYDVDDGAKTINDSILLLQEEIKQGTSLIFFTPHFYYGHNYYDAGLLRQRTEELSQLDLVKNSNLKLFLGNECFYNYHLIEDLLNKEALTMGNSNYVLVEFDYNSDMHHIINACRELYNEGFKIIIAHMERYTVFEEKHIKELKDLNVEFQMNANYIIQILSTHFLNKNDKYNKKLLKNGVISYIGSDTHNMKTRPPKIQQAANLIQQKIPKHAEDILYNNALKLL